MYGHTSILVNNMLYSVNLILNFNYRLQIADHGAHPVVILYCSVQDPLHMYFSQMLVLQKETANTNV